MQYSNKIICGTTLLAGSGITLYCMYKKRFEIGWKLTSFYSHVKMYIMPRRMMHSFELDTSLKVPYRTGDDPLSFDYKFKDTQYSITYAPNNVIIFPPFDQSELSKAYVPDYEYYITDENKTTCVTDEKIKNKIIKLSGPLKNFYEDKKGVHNARNVLLENGIIKPDQKLILYDVLLDEEKKY